MKEETKTQKKKNEQKKNCFMCVRAPQLLSHMCALYGWKKRSGIVFRI